MTFVLFPSTPVKKVHPKIQDLMHGGQRLRVKLAFERLWISYLLWGMDLVLDNRVNGALVRRCAKSLVPDFVHSLEIQHAGYIMGRAFRKATEFEKPKLMLTNYGSDIFWFKNFRRHARKITQVLSVSNYYSAECERDVKLAHEYGFQGLTLPTIPNAGGIDVGKRLDSLRTPSERNVILIKGYDNWVGRARYAVQALALLSHELIGYEIIFYSCNARTIRAVNRLKRSSPLSLTTFKKNHFQYEEMLNLFASARIYLGVSLSDGISTSMLEALALGAFPVQTTTACVDEWFSDGVTGISLRDMTPEGIAEAVREALSLTARISRTQFASERVAILEKINTKTIQKIALRFYES